MHPYILGFGIRDAQRVMETLDEDGQDRHLVHLCGDPDSCTMKMKGKEFGMDPSGGKPAVVHAKKWRYLSGEEVMRMKHPGAGLKAYDKSVVDLQAQWDALHPDSRATGGPNSPARVIRGKGNSEEKDGEDDEEEDVEEEVAEGQEQPQQEQPQQEQPEQQPEAAQPRRRKARAPPPDL